MKNEYSESTQFIDLASQQRLIRSALEESIKRVLDHGQYIMGPEVRQLESQLSVFTGAGHTVTCANGTDALSVVLMGWGIGQGDAVFVPSFTYVASAEAPAQLGATPFFVDVDEGSFNIDVDSFAQGIIDAKKLGLRPAAVVVVDLFGQPADVDSILGVAASEGIKVLVDGAQSFGATYRSRKVGSMGHATTTSFFPAKPLGCYGDGGAIFTNSPEDAMQFDSIRLHGRGGQKYDNVRIGMNSRMDTIQAAILLTKLELFAGELIKRNQIAQKYSAGLNSVCKTPMINEGMTSAWAQYTIVVDNRDELKKRLAQRDIPTGIYYPIPLSEQDGYKQFPAVSSGVNVSKKLSKQVLSLPMHPYLSAETQEKIIMSVKACVRDLS